MKKKIVTQAAVIRWMELQRMTELGEAPLSLVIVR
jgi:hypothetical protein